MSINEEIQKLRKEVEEKAAMLQKLETEHFNIYGIWEITTEGDVEGRSTKKLGTYKGSLFDAVKKYGDQGCYSLTCTRIGHYTPTNFSIERKVHFRVYDKAIKMHDYVDTASKLKDSIPDGHHLTESNYFGCVALRWKE
ncbi:hypothetical protein [Paenibacillus medicaginis]|uniref:Uncharacterized protein n=1 Tax=Paenibacillus medicaginis TaxID=1470560 RepID=A0ABV5BUP8_9BACL